MSKSRRTIISSKEGTIEGATPEGLAKSTNLAFGFSKSLDQVFASIGEFGSFPPQEYSKSVRDFIANRAGVCPIDLNIYVASFRHGKNSGKIES